MSRPLGVLLAGGAAQRMGGDKLRAPLLGRPLALWALDALLEVRPRTWRSPRPRCASADPSATAARPDVVDG